MSEQLTTAIIIIPPEHIQKHAWPLMHRYARDDLGFLNMIHVKPSAYRDMLRRLGLTAEQGVYNDNYGHIGEQDSIINMIEGEKQGRLKDGDLMIIVAAGIGYVWGASCVKWGRCDA